MTDAARGADTPRERVWVSRWYRIQPSTFEQYELFFEPETVYAVYADESFKSILLRRNGRGKEATEIGEAYVDVPSSELLDNERSFAIATSSIEQIKLRAGSFVFKPRMRLVTDSRTYDFYHPSRTVETEALAAELSEHYPNSIKISESAAPFSL
ncbi:hypothetical protein [Salinigranum halophilum]|uniref:hypothetical protein n=1 Tax=Salinigranum halophilum TaxID=2565931 RepID=UPI0010A817C2|nr:hypothetical protein [Salinigranum halophilum]